MSITQTAMTTAVALQYKRTDKSSEITQAIQYIVDDIQDSFEDFRDLDTVTSALTVTNGTASVDISTALSTLYGNRIRKVVLIDSANNDNDQELTEIDYHNEYLEWLPDPSNPDSSNEGYPEEYARYTDNLYLKRVPGYDNLTLKVYFQKVHPTVTSSQDILYPADFKQCIFHGVMWYLYSFVERKDALAEKHERIYQQLKIQKINAFQARPNKPRITRYCDYVNGGDA